jgi:hypothetical protein
MDICQHVYLPTARLTPTPTSSRARKPWLVCTLAPGGQRDVFSGHACSQITPTHHACPLVSALRAHACPPQPSIASVAGRDRVRTKCMFCSANSASVSPRVWSSLSPLSSHFVHLNMLAMQSSPARVMMGQARPARHTNAKRVVAVKAASKDEPVKSALKKATSVLLAAGLVMAPLEGEC